MGPATVITVRDTICVTVGEVRTGARCGGLSAQAGQTQPLTLPGRHGPQNGSKKPGAGGVIPPLAAP